MKIVDEKGKLFGRINVIDLLVILVIAVALVFVGAKLFGGGSADIEDASAADSSSVQEVKGAKLTYTVRVTAQPEEVAQTLKRYVDISAGKKDQLQHGGALLENAYVVDYWTESCRCNVNASGIVEYISPLEAESAGLVDIYFVVEAVVENVVTNAMNGQEVRIGKLNNVKTCHFEFAHGYVVDCEWETLEE